MKVFNSRPVFFGLVSSIAIIFSFCSGRTGYVDTIVLESFDSLGTDLVIGKGEKIWLSIPENSSYYDFLVNMHSLEPVRMDSLKTWPIVEIDPYMINGSNYLRIRDTDYVMNLFDHNAITFMLRSTFYERYLLDQKARLLDRLFGDVIDNIDNKDFEIPSYELTGNERWLMNYQPFFNENRYGGAPEINDPIIPSPGPK